MRSVPAQPLIFLHAISTCPRCGAPRVLALAIDRQSTVEWHECDDCRYLWAVPKAHVDCTVAPVLPWAR